MEKPEFWGRDTVLAEKEKGARRKLVGLVSTGRAIPRPHMSVSLVPDVLLGEITSGTFSPSLKQGIGLALVARSLPTTARSRSTYAAAARSSRSSSRRFSTPRSGSPDEPPEPPPAFRPPTPSERPWWWRLEDADGAEVPLSGDVADEYADRRFASQADAESWIGEFWAELEDAGVAAVTLIELERVVYGPMALSA